MLVPLVSFVSIGIILKTAKIDITPPELLPLGGYTARKGVICSAGGSKLYAHVLILGNLTLVSVDMLTVPEGLYEEVRKKSGCPNLWIVATHTHCAPDSQMLNPKMTMVVPGIASFSPRWFSWYSEKLCEAIQTAQTSPASLVASLDLVRTRVKLNRGRRKGAKPDETAWVLKSSGKPLLASYAAHATFHEESWNRTDGDWPGLLSDRLDCAVVPGAIGDVSPFAPGHGPVEKCENWVEKFVVSTSKTRGSRVWSSSKPHKVMAQQSALSGPVPHPSFAKAYGVPDALAGLLVNRFAQQSCWLQAAAFGKFLIVGIPGEPSADVGRQIQALAKKQGFPHCLVLSHTNGWIGYILNPEDYDRGGYEATLSFNGRTTSETLVESAKGLISNISREDVVGRALAMIKCPLTQDRSEGLARAGHTDRAWP